MSTQSQIGLGTRHSQVSVRDAMRVCTRNVVVVALAFAVVIAFLYVLPDIWYGWARSLTRGYTNASPAVGVLWGSIFLAGWCLCVAEKLEWNRASRPFWGGALLFVCTGVLPAQCALFAMLVDGRSGDTFSFVEKIGYGSVWIVAIAGLLSALAWLMVAIHVTRS